jgi:hypothetical protein
MWVNCHQCQGNGYLRITCINYVTIINCWLCHKDNSYLRGQIWVEDNYEPVSQPNSPRPEPEP